MEASWWPHVSVGLTLKLQDYGKWKYHICLCLCGKFRTIIEILFDVHKGKRLSYGLLLVNFFTIRTIFTSIMGAYTDFFFIKKGDNYCPNCSTRTHWMPTVYLVFKIALKIFTVELKFVYIKLLCLQNVFQNLRHIWQHFLLWYGHMCIVDTTVLSVVLTLVVSAVFSENL